MATPYLYSFLLALIFAMGLFPILIRHSARWGLVDDPTGNCRKIHSDVIPRSGGLGIILAAASSALIVLPSGESLFSFVLACLVIISFGLLDDIVELKPLQKLGGQAIGVSIAMMGGMNLSDLPMLESSPIWFNKVITFTFVMAVINGVNFSDGMDGLAAGTTLMGLALIVVLAIESANITVSVISLAISAAVLGFLRFNTHPAKIFMGDAGSQFLGFSLAWLAINVSQDEASQLTKLAPLLILGIPIMDILQVVPVRIHKKLPIPGPDKEHFHHQIARFGFPQHEVVAIIYLLQAILLGSAYGLRFDDDWLVFSFYMLFVAAVLGTIYFANYKGWRFRQQLSPGSYERRNFAFRRLSGLHRYTDRLISGAILLVLFAAAVLSSALPASLVFTGFGVAVLLTLTGPFFLPSLPVLMGRLASYAAVILLVYGVWLSLPSYTFNMVTDGALAVFGMVLIFSMRITRSAYFGLTNEDLLIAIFFVALVPLMLIEFGQGSRILSLIFRILVLLYACEYLLARGQKAINQLTIISISALFLAGIHL